MFEGYEDLRPLPDHEEDHANGDWELEQRKESLALRWFTEGCYTGEFLRGLQNGTYDKIADLFDEMRHRSCSEVTEFGKGCGVEFSEPDCEADVSKLTVLDMPSVEGIIDRGRGSNEMEHTYATGLARDINLHALKICTVLKVLEDAKDYEEWKDLFYQAFVSVKGFKERFLHPSVFKVGLEKAVTAEDKMRCVEVMVSFNVKPDKTIYDVMFCGLENYAECKKVRDKICEEGMLTAWFNDINLYHAWMKRVDQFEGDIKQDLQMVDDEGEPTDKEPDTDIRVAAKLDVLINAFESDVKITADSFIILLSNTSDADFEYVLYKIGENPVLHELIRSGFFLMNLILSTDSHFKRGAIINWIISLPHPEDLDKPLKEQRTILPGEVLVRLSYSMCETPQEASSMLDFMKLMYKNSYEMDGASELPDYVFETMFNICIQRSKHLIILVEWLMEKRGMALDKRFFDACKASSSVSELLGKLKVERGDDFPLSDEDEKAFNEMAYHYVDEKEVEKEALMDGLGKRSSFSLDDMDFGDKANGNSGTNAEGELAEMIEEAVAKKAAAESDDDSGKGLKPWATKRFGKFSKNGLVKRKQNAGLLAPSRGLMVAFAIFEHLELKVPARIVESINLHPLLCAVMGNSFYDFYDKCKIKPFEAYEMWRNGGEAVYEEIFLNFVKDIHGGSLYVMKPHEYMAECKHPDDFMIMARKMFDDEIEPSDEIVDGVNFGARGLRAGEVLFRLKRFFADPDLYGDDEEGIDIDYLAKLHMAGVSFEEGEGWLELYSKALENSEFSGGKMKKFRSLLAVLIEDLLEQEDAKADGEEFDDSADPLAFVEGFKFARKKDYVRAYDILLELCKEYEYNIEEPNDFWCVANYLLEKAGKKRMDEDSDVPARPKVEVFMERVTDILERAKAGEEGAVDALNGLVAEVDLQGGQLNKAANAVQALIGAEEGEVGEVLADFYGGLRALAVEAKRAKRKNGNGKGPVKRKK